MVEIKRLDDRGAVAEIAGTDQRAVNQQCVRAAYV